MVLPNKAKACLAYGYSLLEHKYFVYIAGQGSVSLWRLVKHDASKFLPSEFFPYAYFWQGDNYGIPRDKAAFKAASRLHKSRNDHHFEHWQREDGSITGAMSHECIKEMVADWFGAARAYNREWPLDTATWEWWQDNRDMLQTNMQSSTYGLVLKEIAAAQKRLENAR